MLNNTNSNCNQIRYFKIREWLITWTVLTFCEFLCSIFNSGFFLEKWSYLNRVELFLRTIFILIGIFLFIWIWVGISRVFTNTDCQNRINYIESYSIWGISMAILIFWIIVFGLISLGLLCACLNAAGFFRNYSFKFHEASIIFTVFHLIFFVIMVI